MCKFIILLLSMNKPAKVITVFHYIMALLLKFTHATYLKSDTFHIMIESDGGDGLL